MKGDNDMRKLSVSILTTLIIVGGLLSSTIWTNGFINANTSKGNHSTTTDIDINKQECNNASSYLKNVRCVDYEKKSE